MQKRNKSLLARIIALLILVSTVIPDIVAFAYNDLGGNGVKAAENTWVDCPDDSDEYQMWKDNLAPQVTSSSAIDITAMAMSLNGNMMYNNFIEAYVDGNGKFTMGTTGGNPNIASDDNQKLLYGHPTPWSSETLIRVDNSDKIFFASSRVFNSEGTQCTSTGMIGDVEVKQVLAFETNPYTSRQDIMSIKYIMTNKGSTTKSIGARIMLDTQLGKNDSAHFRIPGIGDVTTEREFVGSTIPQYWQAFDNLANPGVLASGTFYRTESEMPNKVQFAHWLTIRGSSWNYSITNGRSVTGDSAVAAYFNPASVSAGQSRTIVTYYGLSDFAFSDLTGELGARITAPPSLQANASGTAYMDNPFTITAYVANQTSGTLTNVQATLALPAGMALTASQTATAYIGSLASGAERLVSWQVCAEPQSTAKTLYYNIKINSSSVSNTIPMTISLPRVNNLTVDSLSLNKTSCAMTAGNTETLVATLRTGTTSLVAKIYEVRWETTNAKVAIVAPDGTVTAVGNGTATIRAISADNSKTATCSITVAARTTTEIDLWTLSSLAYHDFTSSDKDKPLSAIASSGTNVFGSWSAISSPTKTDHVNSVLGGFVVDNVMNDNRTSFYGVSFKDLNNGVVIAYRGSNDPMIGWSGIGKDWLDDASFAVFDNMPEQFYQAWLFYKQVKANNPGKTIRLTGHSLGGALASFVSIMEDVEAIVFCAPSGLIIDLAYFINANYIDVFQGIDKWNFKNHYNVNDLVGNRNPDIYRAIAHAHNNHGGVLPPSVGNSHNLESLVAVSGGNIVLTSGSGESNYLIHDVKWERTLNSTKNPNYGMLSQVGVVSSQLNGGRLGRVMLGKSSGSQTLAFPDNLIEVRRNVMFMGGGSTTATGTSSWWGDYYFLSKSGIETVYGRSGDDTYVVFGKGDNTAWIYDSSGVDTIWYKDAAMSEITVTVRSDGQYSVKAGGTGSLVVDKNRNLLQPQIVIKDRYGTTKKLNAFKADASIAGFSAIPLLLEESNVDDGGRTVRIIGNNITIEIFDENMQLLGTFDNRFNDIKSTEFALVFMYSGDNPMIEVDLMNGSRFIKVSGNANVSYSVLNLSATGPGTALYELTNVDLANNATLLVDNKLFATGTGFVLSKSGIDTHLTPNEYKIPSNIISSPSNVEIYAGQTQNVALLFTPANVVTKEVNIEIGGNNPDSITIAPSANGTINITGKTEGKANLLVSSPFDNNIKTIVPIVVLQDTAPQIVPKTNAGAYSAGAWADSHVTIDLVLPAGYDKKFINVGTGFEEAPSGVIINTNGVNDVYAFAQDSVTNKITKTAQIEVKYDDIAPEILNVKNGGEYYIDKCVQIYDVNLSNVTINGILLNETELVDGKWITAPGQHTVVATDMSGKLTTIAFELKALPNTNSLKINDAGIVIAIRKEFEDDKYLLPAERRAELNLAIYNLERKLSALQNKTSSDAEITGFSVEGQQKPESINTYRNTVEVLVGSHIDLSNLTPIIGVSDGAQISPNPFESRNFVNPVKYTVTAADGTEKEWSVSIQAQASTTKPVLQGIATAGNSIALEFNTFMHSDVSIGRIELHRQDGSRVASNIISHLVNEKVISLEFDVDITLLATEEYYILLKSNAVKNVDGLYNDEITMPLNMDGTPQVTDPSYSITATAGTGGTATGGGTFVSGSQATLIATANTNYAFDGWFEGSSKVAGAGTTYSFTVTANRTLEARFTYVSPGGGGTGGGGSGGGGGGDGGGDGVTPSISAALNVTDANYDKSAPKDIAITLSSGSYTFSELKNGEYTLVRDKDYTVDGNTYTIKADYLATLSDGMVTLTFIMSGGNNPTLAITIETGKMESGEISSVSSGILLNGRETDLILNPDGSITLTAADLGGLAQPIILKIPYEGATLTNVGVLKKDGKDIIIPFSVPGSMIMLITEPGTYGVINNQNTFTDTSGHWASGTIDFITAREIYSGVGDNKFDPNGGMTRAMFAQVLANIERANLTAYTTSRFTDVPANKWYTAAVEWAADQGIVSGFGHELFGPNDLITREQMAVMLNNYLKYKEIVLKIGGYSPFADEDKVSSWAKEAVADMKRYGLIAGVGNNTYAPLDTADRASVAQVFRNFIESYIK